MKYDFEIEYECPKCGKKIKYDESMRDAFYLNNECVALRSWDCHGIPFRMLCLDCYEAILDYDGEYYTELDECIDEYW